MKQHSASTVFAYPDRASPGLLTASSAAVGDEHDVVGQLRTSEVKRRDQVGAAPGTEGANDFVARPPPTRGPVLDEVLMEQLGDQRGL